MSFAPTVQQEFEIELEGSQCLRILCYEKCYDKSKLNKDDNEIVDKIMGKGQVQVRGTLYFTIHLFGCLLSSEKMKDFVNTFGLGLLGKMWCFRLYLCQGGKKRGTVLKTRIL